MLSIIVLVWLVEPLPVISFKVQLLLAKSLRRCGLYEDQGIVGAFDHFRFGFEVQSLQ